jgi:excisionase family DNA binding protein
MTVERVAYSVRDVAAATSLSRQAIYDAIDRGEIPAFNIGHRLCVPAAWLDQKIAEALAAVTPVPQTPSRCTDGEVTVTDRNGPPHPVGAAASRSS